MADQYTKPCSSSPVPPSSASEPDEISLFLHQILFRSSSSSSTTSLHNAKLMPSEFLSENPLRQCRSPLISGSDRLVRDGMNSSTGVYFPVSAGTASSSAGGFDNDLDEYDCESEEGLEALVEEVATKAAPLRSSSKRSRAAEVHNLSEKRRRSRINEKMKALQNLIPNSNKTDKASMLDEAIEYLKQLQLQVQMLSMRNGLSLHPMCLPGVLPPVQLSQMRVGIGEENGSLHMDMTGTLPVNQETMEYRLANQGTSSSHPSVPNLTGIMNPETSFGLESSIQAHLGPFQLQTSSADICREDVLPHQQLNISCAGTNSLVSLPYDAQASGVKDSNTLESCIQRRDLSEGMLLKNIEHNQVPFPQLNGMHTGRSVPNDDMKTDRLDF
ncbi:hypothetical protein AAG906_024304 [Vitis piasezkii]